VKRILVITNGLLILAGCSATPERPTIETAGMANPEVALQRSISRVDAAMATLGGMTVARNIQSTVVPAELQKPVSLKWSGPLDEAAKALSKQVGYRFVSNGQASTPVIVTLEVVSQPIINLFKSLGSQAGSRATVTVDAQNHLVEVRYNV